MSVFLILTLLEFANNTEFAPGAFIMHVTLHHYFTDFTLSWPHAPYNPRSSMYLTLVVDLQ